MTNNHTSKRYPLMDHSADQLRTAQGRPLTEITLDAPDLSAEDLRISAEALQDQAEMARQGGYSQLAANLTRAAELTAVPNEELLQMYELLRPRRATFAELTSLAERLEEHYQAPANAQLVKEAAQVYQERGLLRRESDGG